MHFSLLIYFLPIMFILFLQCKDVKYISSCEFAYPQPKCKQPISLDMRLSPYSHIIRPSSSCQCKLCWCYKIPASLMREPLLRISSVLTKAVRHRLWLKQFSAEWDMGETFWQMAHPCGKAHIFHCMTAYNGSKWAVWSTFNPEFLLLPKIVNLRSLPPPRPLQSIMSHLNLVDALIT
jgi:hypothetical protein